MVSPARAVDRWEAAERVGSQRAARALVAKRHKAAAETQLGRVAGTVQEQAARAVALLLVVRAAAELVVIARASLAVAEAPPAKPKVAQRGKAVVAAPAQAADRARKRAA
jgi:hypothetical protein